MFELLDKCITVCLCRKISIHCCYFMASVFPLPMIRPIPFVYRTTRVGSVTVVHLEFVIFHITYCCLA